MALKLGSLYVSLSANTGAFIKSMSQAAKMAEKVAKEIKKASNDVAQASGSFAAVGVAALALASTVDGPTKKAMDGFKQSSQLLAVQVADMLLPAVRALSDLLKQAAGVIAGLDPQVKKQVASFAVWAVEIAAAAKAISVLAAGASTAFGLLRSGFKIIGAVSSTLTIGVVAAVAAVIGVVLLLHAAWRRNWGGIQKITADVVDWFRDAFSKLANFFGGVWDFIIDGFKRMTDTWLDALQIVEELTGTKIGPDGVAGLREGFEGLFKDLKSGEFISGALSDAFDAGKSIGSSLVDGVKEEWAAIQSELGLDKLMSGFTKGKPIALGRGMHKSPKSNGHDAMADMSMATAEAMALAEARDLAAAQKAAAEEADQMAAIMIQAANDADAAGEAQRQAAEEQAKAAEAQAKAASAKMKAIASIAMNGLGALGQTINNIAQGAQAGGIWGAMIAAVMEVFTRMEGFQQMLSTLEYGLKRLGQFMEPLVGELFGIVETLTVVGTEGLKPIFDALKPLFEGLAKFAKKLVPVIASVGNLFEAVGPILEVLANVVGGILDAVSPILDLLAGVVKIIATVVLGIIIGLNEVAAFFGDARARAESDRMKALVDKMWAPGANDLAVAQGEAARETWRNAAAQGAAATATQHAADAAQEVAESLSNVPSGYKIALSRFNAQDAAGPTSYMGLGADVSTNQTIGFGGANGGAVLGGGITINGNVSISSTADNVEDLGDDIRRERARERGQRRGNPYRDN